MVLPLVVVVIVAKCAVCWMWMRWVYVEGVVSSPVNFCFMKKIIMDCRKMSL